MAGKDTASTASRDFAEERLLVEAAQSDPARFGDLYEMHFELVYAYVARRVRDRAAAEDLTSEVFHKALEHLPRFTWRGVPFGAWLIKIASNMIADQRRRTAKEQSSEVAQPVETMPLADASEISQASLEADENSAQLFRLVCQLPADQRRVIELRFGADKSIREIATELGRSEGAVKQLQFRGLENLRSRLVVNRGE